MPSPSTTIFSCRSWLSSSESDVVSQEPGPPPLPPHRDRRRKGRRGSLGAGEKKKGGSGGSTPRPGVSAAAGAIRAESLGGSHLAHLPSPCARPRPLSATSGALPRICANPRRPLAFLAGRRIRRPGKRRRSNRAGETRRHTRRDSWQEKKSMCIT